MNTIPFDKLLLKTAFCCMACDGNIDSKEISTIKTICEDSGLYQDFNFEKEINTFVTEFNESGKEFIIQYFKLLKDSPLTEEQELIIVDFALKTIYADEIVEYSEIKFFKVIRQNLKISDEKILTAFPGNEQFLEKDIITESYLEKIISQYLDTIELPKFDIISFT